MPHAAHVRHDDHPGCWRNALAGQRARLMELRRRGHWPAQVPAVVLTEALTGDHRRGFHVNRLLRACQLRDVDEPQARGGCTAAHVHRPGWHDLGDRRDRRGLREHLAEPSCAHQ
ncbi:MAG: hypothetical protein LC799_22625 [Actinobacteria bacterium]|nr:hypothetical protein [Actinomycetota bacterium]